MPTNEETLRERWKRLKKVRSYRDLTEKDKRDLVGALMLILLWHWTNGMDAKRLPLDKNALKKAVKRYFDKQGDVDAVMRRDVGALSDVAARIMRDAERSRGGGSGEDAFKAALPRLSARQAAKAREALDAAKKTAAPSAASRADVGAQIVKTAREAATEQAARRLLGRISAQGEGRPGKGVKAVLKEAAESVLKPVFALKEQASVVTLDQALKAAGEKDRARAVAKGAVGAFWDANPEWLDYDHRPHHLERDGEFYAVPDNWAMAAGLMRKDARTLHDAPEQPMELINCKCWWNWVYDPSDERIPVAFKS